MKLSIASLLVAAASLMNADFVFSAPTESTPVELNRIDVTFRYNRERSTDDKHIFVKDRIQRKRKFHQSGLSARIDWIKQRLNSFACQIDVDKLEIGCSKTTANIETIEIKCDRGSSQCGVFFNPVKK